MIWKVINFRYNENIKIQFSFTVGVENGERK